ncbi:MAG: cbb3-type cytochrome c oxidase subunit I [Anaerolineae bacterium]|nr:cbb3-type cytochrome c oxidase subunit I [Anaerolineae bacterium]
MRTIVKGLVGGAIAFLIGAGLVALIRSLTGVPAWSTEQAITVGWLFALIGWLLGVGIWDYWAREWVNLPLRENNAVGLARYFTFNTDHKVVGVQYLITFVFLFLLAGLLAMVLRLELMQSGRDFLNGAEYNNVMSLHGTIMIFVGVAATVGAFGNYIVPIMIGAEDMAYPRLNALSFWFVPPVVILLLASVFVGGYDTGWTGYAPLGTVTRLGEIYYNLAFFTLGFSSILGSINILTTIITLRTRGLGWGRLPIFVWSVFGTSVLTLIFTQFVALAMIMNLLDRVAGFSFFDAAQGGDPLFYQNVFWFYSHPAVYVMILPGLGIALEIIAHFSRKPLFAYKWAVGGMLGVVVLSAVVWAHHMFTSGMSGPLRIPFMITTELISVPTGLVFLSALGTMWQGRLNLKTPMLFALGVIFNFLIGGMTGIFLSDIPVDIHLQDTFFVVGHFHYTIVGGGIFALFAGIYYWFPKITGRMYNEAQGKIHFWWMLIGFNLTFLPMFSLGMNGMNRRVADYLPELGGGNMFVSLSAFFLGAGFLLFVYNMIRSMVQGSVAGANPWGARTLEWQVPSPPPLRNFEQMPEVVGDPYGYGEPDSTHAVIPAPAGD